MTEEHDSLPQDPQDTSPAGPAQEAGTPDTTATSTDTIDLPGTGGRTRRRWPIWTLAGALVLLALAGAGTAYAAHYSDVALPRTTLAGTDVSGMTRSEIVSLVEKKAEATTVAIDGDTTATASLADLGTTVDAQATADAVMAANGGFIDRLGALLSPTDVAVVSTTDDQTASTYATSIIPSDRQAAVNAAVTLDTGTSTFGISPASSGTAIDSSLLTDAAKKAAGSLKDQSVTVAFETAEPTVSDAEAQTVADTANTWVAQDVTIASADGKTSYTATAADKASWITVTATPSAPPTLSVNAEAVKSWVSTEAADAKVEAVNGERNVNSSGTVVATVTEAVDGQDVSNAETIVTDITTALGAGTAYSGTFAMTTTPATWTDRQIADGAENLPYPAAPGEKWVDINLSSKTVTAYEGATVVYGPVSVVDGAAATPTVTGTYHVYLKYETQTMRGQNADGSNYVTEGVPWVTYWYQGYALHGAPWRSSFGFSGSHGCVNMTVSDAKWFYDWTEIGNAVVSHY